MQGIALVKPETGHLEACVHDLSRRWVKEVGSVLLLADDISFGSKSWRKTHQPPEILDMMDERLTCRKPLTRAVRLSAEFRASGSLQTVGNVAFERPAVEDGFKDDSEAGHSCQ